MFTISQIRIPYVDTTKCQNSSVGVRKFNVCKSGIYKLHIIDGQKQRSKKVTIYLLCGWITFLFESSVPTKSELKTFS